MSAWNSTSIPERVHERAFTAWQADMDCWISTYSVGSHGYAQVGWKDASGKVHTVLAHRASWEHEKGPVPVGMTLDHICKQKKCVNPGHLRILPNFENARRTSGRDWPLGQCVHGHSNEYLSDFSGHRRCSICVQKSRGHPRAKRTREPKPRKPPATHCVHGHEKTAANSYLRPSGRRECLPCKVESARLWHATHP